METTVVTTAIAAARPATPAPLHSQSCGLLRALAMCRSEAADRLIEQLAPGIADWDTLIHHGEAHGVLPLMFLRLRETGAPVPATVMHRLQEEYGRNVMHCMANAAELIALLDAFGRQGIQAMPFKGVVLAATVYGDLAARRGGDLDLLVHYHDLPRATTVLQDRGYSLTTPTREDGSPALSNYYEYVFERRSDGLTVELRWRLELVQPRFRRNLGLEWASSESRIAKLAGSEVPNLSAEKTLLMLCMHGSHHKWERLLWVRDVAQLIECEKELNWEAAIREAKHTGLWRSLALGVLVANRVAGAPVPDAILRRFASDSSCGHLAQHFDQHIVDGPGTLPAGFFPYNIRLLDLRDRIMAILTLDFMRPGARDRAVIQLPKPLEGLYWIIRPIRVLKDRSARP